MLGAAPAAGQSPDTAPSPEDKWVFRVAPYLWATSMDGNATVGGIKSDVDVPFSDILKDLSFGAMLAADMQKGRVGIGVNALYARVSPDSEVGRSRSTPRPATPCSSAWRPTTASSNGPIARRRRASPCA
jgi:hypothetical protein